MTDLATAHVPSDPVSQEATQSKVLVVDDDEALIAISQRTLERAGYQVTLARDGVEALELLERGDFDLVVSDIDMPRLDGIGVLRALRDRQADVPVILITGYPRVETAVSAVNLGAVRYLIKPFNPVDLTDAARRALGGRQLARLSRRMAMVVQEQAQVRARDRERFGNALDQLYMVFQPIVRMPARAIFGHEALVRTREPSIPHPGVLFETSERLDETLRLSRLIRTRTAAAFAEAPADSLIFVNLHASDLNDPELVEQAAPLTEHAPRVVLEVAERASIGNIREASNCIERLRKLGYRVAVDDIGSGYAGLTSFAMLEPDIVKLDMALVRDVDKSETKRRLIESFVSVCRSMRIPVVSEGVETQAELDTLLDLGCELFQGFLLARPDRRFRSSL